MDDQRKVLLREGDDTLMVIDTDHGGTCYLIQNPGDLYERLEEINGTDEPFGFRAEIADDPIVLTRDEAMTAFGEREWDAVVPEPPLTERSALDRMADAQGWDRDSLVNVLLSYAEKFDDPEGFQQHLKDIAATENDGTDLG